MSRARRPFVSIAVLSFTTLLFARPGAAQGINITSGYLDGRPGNYNAPVVIAGDRGFSFTTNLNFSYNLTGPDSCNSNPRQCTPGSTASLKTVTNFSSGTATLDGQTYTDFGGIDSKNGMYLDFSGSITLPALAPTADITTNVTFQGNFNHSNTNSPLTGNVLAHVYLSSPGDPSIPNSWHIDRVLFQFPVTTPLTAVSADIGAVGQPGSANFDTSDGAFHIYGSGADIWGTADAFHYYAMSLFSQTGVAEVKLDRLSATDPFAKAGVMLRAGLTPGAPHIILDVRPDGGIEFMQRATADGSTSFIAGGTTTFPVWLRLTRAQQSIAAEVSNDGSSWRAIGSVASGCCSLAGLAVTSHDNSTRALGVFEFPKLELQWPWADYEFSDAGQVGFAWNHMGTTFVRGGGADIWGTHDTFNYLTQSVHADAGEIVARVLSLENTNTFAKAGVMMTGSGTVVLDIRPTGDIEFMARTSSGGSMQSIASATHALPVWLKLNHTGQVFTGFISSDGSTWSQIGSASIDPSYSGYSAGLAVTSHDTTKFNTAAFDNVTITRSGSASTPPPPPPPPAPDIVLYANDVPSGTIHGVFAKTSDSTSPGGIALTTPAGGAAQPNNPLAAPADYFDVTFNVDADVPYTLWIRVKAAANSKLSDSLWVQLSDAKASGAPAYPIGSTSGLLVNLATDSTASSLHDWGWANGAYWLTQAATVTFGLTGQHTMRIQPREYGVMLDQIVLSPSRFFNADAHCPNSCAGAPGPLSNDTTIVPKP